MGSFWDSAATFAVRAFISYKSIFREASFFTPKQTPMALC